jgi:hypothetical protein
VFMLFLHQGLFGHLRLQLHDTTLKPDEKPTETTILIGRRAFKRQCL